MKKNITLFLLQIFAVGFGAAQTATNKLEATGNVGVGTTTPGSTSGAILDVQNTSGVNVQAQFGSTIPIYLITNNANLGFNAYYNSGWKYGAGSAGSYGGALGFDHASGTLRYWVTPTAGSANEGIYAHTYAFSVLQNGNFGIGTNEPSVKLHIQNATEQLRLAYDASNFASFTVDNARNLSIGNSSPYAIRQLSVNYSAGAYGTGGLKLSDATYGQAVVLQSMSGNKLYVTSASGSPTSVTAGAFENPWDGSQLVAAQNKWYLTTGSLGIGTSAPQATLDVNGNARFATDVAVTSRIIAGGTGYINGDPLQVLGNASIYGNIAGVGRISNNNYAASSFLVLPDDPNGWRFFTTNTAKNAGIERLHIGAASDITTFSILNSNVGIGTNTPGPYKLAVEGVIGARKVKVTQATWADYVFENDYYLPTLKEVEIYINQHKHLPGIVSAKQVEQDGIDLGENQAALLKKIEELTLYVIEMKKEIAEQKKGLHEQREEIKKFKRGLKKSYEY